MLLRVPVSASPTLQGRKRRNSCCQAARLRTPRPSLVAQRWHELGPPPLSARDSRELGNAGALEEAPMAIVAGFDVHRAQITFDALDTESGEVSRGRIDATPAAVARWVQRFTDHEIHVAVEACTGWLFVCDALVAAGAVPHLAEPVETRALRGRKRRAKTDREDARWLRAIARRRPAAGGVDPARACAPVALAGAAAPHADRRAHATVSAHPGDAVSPRRQRHAARSCARAPAAPSSTSCGCPPTRPSGSRSGASSTNA